ncbi:MAG TPA: hypothetical protein DDW20_05250 [Firmicutes bacterium]|nr:hypothetical protein [Bacillota bacterium]
MGEFFKTVLFGLLYVVLSPFIVLFLALYFIYCLIIFIYMSVRNLIVFFSGGTVNGDLPEDIKAKRILKDKMEQKNAPINTTQNLQQQNLYNMSNATIIMAHPDMINNLKNMNNNQQNINQVNNPMIENKPIEQIENNVIEEKSNDINQQNNEEQ